MKPFPDTFWKCTTVASMSATLLLAFRSPDVPNLAADTVRARQFLLLDAAGKPVGEWGSDQDYPKAISFRMYDPESKSGEPSIRMLSVDGGVEISIFGDTGSGRIGLMTRKGWSRLWLSDTCNDASHNPPEGSALVFMSASDAEGTLRVSRRTTATMDGQHVHLEDPLLIVPDPRAHPPTPGGK